MTKKKGRKATVGSRLKAKVGDKASHVIVEAYAGTGKTFTLIVGVAWSFMRHRWKEVQRRLAKIKGKPGLKIEPSGEQQEVWNSMALSRNVRTITYCAFNKSIVTEFSREWGWLVQMLAEEGIALQFATVNSLGHKTIMRSYGRVRVYKHHTENLLANAMHMNPWELKKKEPLLIKTVSQLVGLCKLTLTGMDPNYGLLPQHVIEDQLDQLVAHYDIDLNGSRRQVMDLVPQILAMSTEVEATNEIDFDDQNWLPIVCNLSIPKVDLLLVDEGQDLPRCKQEFVRKLGRRVILVGDPNQAIYGFAGADTEAIYRMRSLLGSEAAPLEPLKLTETRRCGKAIVDEARRIVPDFRAHPDNSQGNIQRTTLNKYAAEVQDGDMVLCRVNAPLVSQALRFIKDGRKAIIRGRDFGTSLANFVEKFNAPTVSDLVEKVDQWRYREDDKEYRKRNPSEARLMSIADRHECVLSFTEGADTVDQVVSSIRQVFAGKVCPVCGRHYSEETSNCTNKDCASMRNSPGRWPTGAELVVPEGVQFSSVHKAKGLENDRVFILTPPGAGMPHPMAKSQWQMKQEMNCLFIAITRAKDLLVYVS